MIGCQSTSREVLRQQVIDQVKNQLGPSIAGLDVQFSESGGVLCGVLSGRAPNYHTKQIAQVIAQCALELDEVRNDITVAG